mmetsp:Transcript_2475/g.4969  ORF Transcript_2475/g.4969 Transcript_2475/m.4969 type:complete len:252 (+) Transcript_2475:111-866(+)
MSLVKYVLICFTAPVYSILIDLQLVFDRPQLRVQRHKHTMCECKSLVAQSVELPQPILHLRLGGRVGRRLPLLLQLPELDTAARQHLVQPQVDGVDSLVPGAVLLKLRVRRHGPGLRPGLVIPRIQEPLRRLLPRQILLPCRVPAGRLTGVRPIPRALGEVRQRASVRVRGRVRRSLPPPVRQARGGRAGGGGTLGLPLLLLLLLDAHLPPPLLRGALPPRRRRVARARREHIQRRARNTAAGRLLHLLLL